MRDRRSERRLLCADLVQIEIDAGGRTVANLEDISRSGACLQLEAAVRRGSDVEIVCSRCRLKGKVRYCRFVATGYSVGVEFDRGNAWDPALFQPQHLFDLLDVFPDADGPPQG